MSNVFIKKKKFPSGWKIVIYKYSHSTKDSRESTIIWYQLLLLLTLPSLNPLKAKWPDSFWVGFTSLDKAGEWAGLPEKLFFNY